VTLVALILLVLKISIILSVLAIGLKETFADATFLFRAPGHLARAILAMYVIMPIVALVIAYSFNLHPAVKIALVVLSVSPIPPILPNRAFKAGGKTNYTIGLLVATALLAIVFIPIILEVFERVTLIPLGITMNSIASRVLATIVVPLLLGILIRAFLPKIAERVARPLSLIGAVLLLLGFLPVLFGSLRAIWSLIGDGTVVSLAAFALIHQIAEFAADQGSTCAKKFHQRRIGVADHAGGIGKSHPHGGVLEQIAGLLAGYRFRRGRRNFNNFRHRWRHGL